MAPENPPCGPTNWGARLGARNNPKPLQLHRYLKRFGFSSSSSSSSSLKFSSQAALPQRLRTWLFSSSAPPLLCVFFPTTFKIPALGAPVALDDAASHRCFKSSRRCACNAVQPVRYMYSKLNKRRQRGPTGAQSSSACVAVTWTAFWTEKAFSSSAVNGERARHIISRVVDY